MSTVGRAALEGARVKRIAGGARALTAAMRRADRVLSRRQRGYRAERIAAELKASVADVRAIIRHARQAGDPRALTEREAAARAAELAVVPPSPVVDLPPVVAVAYAPVPVALPIEIASPPEPIVRPDLPSPSDLAALLLNSSRNGFVARLRDIARHHRETDPVAASSLMHLADLHEHHAGTYPTYLIGSDGATLEGTNRRFPRSGVVGSMSSPAYACTVD